MNEKSNKLMRPVREYFKQNWGILAALVAMCLFFSIFGSNFLTKTNIVNLLRTCATNCYLAIGVQMAIILAGIDLTGGALAAGVPVRGVEAVDGLGQYFGASGFTCSPGTGEQVSMGYTAPGQFVF